MGCCGNKRAALAQQNQKKAIRMAGEGAGQMQVRPANETVYFRYIGKTALSVRGIFSQRLYRFSVPGAVVAVDGRDAPGVAAVPNLIRARAPE